MNSARHYVYIENQHFISGLHGDTSVTNRIADVLLNRIMRAHTEGRNFKVGLLGVAEDGDSLIHAWLALTSVVSLR